jgi:hypothetical protein
MATVQDVPTTAPTPLRSTEHASELILYSHSSLVYWWPVWVFGYLMAMITWFGGEQITIGNEIYHIHPSKNLGVIFTVTTLLVILFTNVTVRGLASFMVILAVMFVTVLFAWLGWWDNIIALYPYFGIHMTLGFYVTISTGLLIMWLLAFFVFDRFRFWRIRPGQMTQERIIGEGEVSYDTRGMLFERHLTDFFRHTILGLGAGDLRILTTGAKKEEVYIPNVLFVNRKVKAIQRLIAIKPDEVTGDAVVAGQAE